MLPGFPATGRLAALAHALRRCVACRALRGVRSGFSDLGFHGAPGDQARVLCLTEGIVRGCGLCMDRACTCTGHGYARRASDAGTRSTPRAARCGSRRRDAGRCGSRRRSAACFREAPPSEAPAAAEAAAEAAPVSGDAAAGSGGRCRSRRRDAACFGRRRRRKRRPLWEPPQKRRLFSEAPPPEAPAAAGAAVEASPISGGAAGSAAAAAEAVAEAPPVSGGAAAGSGGRCGSRRRSAACSGSRRRRGTGRHRSRRRSAACFGRRCRKRRPLRKPPQKRRLFREAPPPEAGRCGSRRRSAACFGRRRRRKRRPLRKPPSRRRLFPWSARGAHGPSGNFWITENENFSVPIDSGMAATKNAPGAETPGALYRVPRKRKAPEPEGSGAGGQSLRRRGPCRMLPGAAPADGRPPAPAWGRGS